MDTIDQRYPEAAQRESEERFRFLTDSIPQMVWAARPDGFRDYGNQRLLDYLGKTLEEIQGWAWVEMVHPDDRQGALEASRRAIQAGAEYRLEIRIKNGRTGEYRWFMVHALPHRDAQGRVLRWYGTCTDIQDRILAEKALRESENQLQTILESAPVGIIVADANGTFIFRNKLAEEIFAGQITGDAFGPESGYALLGPDGSPLSPDDLPLPQALRGKATRDYEFLVRYQSGKEKLILAFAQPIVTASGELSGAVASLLDISERKKAEEELKKRSEQLEEAQKVAKLGSWEWDAVHDEITWSKELYRMFELEPENFQATFETFLEYVHPDDQQTVKERISEALEKIKPYADDHRIITASGREKFVHSRAEVICDQNGRPVLMRGSCQDITDQHAKETELMKIAKLESLGILAGGIAHDFNNILTSIMGNIELARMILPPGSNAADKLALTGQACERAKNLSQQLLTFAKGGAPVKKVHSVAELIREAVELALRGANVKSSFTFPADLWPAEVDDGQFMQVVNNLAINADQAMPEGGTLEIVAANMLLEKGNEFGLAAGRYLKIDFRDQGIGIPQKYLDKVFDPYFTTKEKGSGLGLAISYSIINRHNGTIAIESRPGEGSTFSIFLPASEKEQTALRSAEKREAVQGSERVLFMDDDENVTRTVTEMLQYLGYRVDTVKDGVEAIIAYEEGLKKRDPYRIVITDLTVPGGMGGKETVRRLLEIDSEAKVLVSSGYANDPVVAHYARYGFKGEISKPYKLSELAETLRQVIGNG